MKNASTFFIKGTRALVDHAAAAALISGAGRRSWPQHGPGAARHLIRRNGQGFPRPFSWRPVSGPHRGPEAARSRAGLICAAAATVQGALASRMQDGHVVVKIQCSLIPCRGRQAPVIQRGRVRASIAFMYPRPRKHRLCIHTPACLGYALEPYALREQHEGRARGRRSRQELHQETGHGFPCLFSWRPVSGPHRGPGGGGRMPRPAMLAADLCRSGPVNLRACLRS